MDQWCVHGQVTVFKVEDPQEGPSGNATEGQGAGGRTEMGGAGVSVGSGALRVNFCCAKIEANEDVFVDVEQQIDLLGTWGLSQPVDLYIYYIYTRICSVC